jgi:KaiC/GvpD/RAD55 family RecA-like ATPase
MIRSGIAPIDELISVRSPATTVVTGGAGSGKTAFGLAFASAGLARGERVAMLVHARRAALLAHAGYLGVDIATGLRDGRLMIVRYRDDFARRFAESPSPEHVLQDLQGVWGRHRRKRIVIDSVTPLLDAASPAGVAAAAVAQMLERSGAAALLTYPGDVGDSYDRRLEPLIQHAAAILRLTRESSELFRLDALSVRYARALVSTVRFSIRRGVGIAPMDSGGDSAVSSATHGRVVEPFQVS